jgi:carbon-monoxide dehydrogenase large subunit
MKRKEDPRFIRGKGRYVDDIQLPGMVYMDIVRSPYAHAKITAINTEEALKIPGVLAVITGRTLAEYDLHWMPTLMSDTQMVLPTDKVMYQAQEVAAVIATDRYSAADGVEAVEVEYDPLPVVVDPFKALEPDAPVLRTDKEDQKDNHIFHWEVGDRDATDKGLRGSDVVVKQDIYIPRIHVASIETCGCVADYDPAMGKLTVYMTTQAPHAVRTVFALVAGHVGLSEEKRVRRQGAGLSRLRYRCCGLGRPRQAGEVDRGSYGEPPGRLLCTRLPHHGGAGCDEGRHHDGAPHQDARGPRLRGRRRESVEVSRGSLLHLHRLV